MNTSHTPKDADFHLDGIEAALAYKANGLRENLRHCDTPSPQVTSRLDDVTEDIAWLKQNRTLIAASPALFAFAQNFLDGGLTENLVKEAQAAINLASGRAGAIEHELTDGSSGVCVDDCACKLQGV